MFELRIFPPWGIWKFWFCNKICLNAIFQNPQFKIFYRRPHTFFTFLPFISNIRSSISSIHILYFFKKIIKYPIKTYLKRSNNCCICEQSEYIWKNFHSHFIIRWFYVCCCVLLISFQHLGWNLNWLFKVII